MVVKDGLSGRHADDMDARREAKQGMPEHSQVETVDEQQEQASAYCSVGRNKHSSFVNRKVATVQWSMMRMVWYFVGLLGRFSHVLYE